MVNRPHIEIVRYQPQLKMLKKLFPELSVWSDQDLARQLLERGIDSVLSKKRSELVSLQDESDSDITQRARLKKKSSFKVGDLESDGDEENGAYPTWSADCPHPNLPKAVVLALEKYRNHCGG